jgi:hypothetical protein
VYIAARRRVCFRRSCLPVASGRVARGPPSGKPIFIAKCTPPSSFFKFFPARFLLALSNTGSSKGLKALLLLLCFLSRWDPQCAAINWCCCVYLSLSLLLLHLWRKQSRKNYSRQRSFNAEEIKLLIFILAFVRLHECERVLCVYERACLLMLLIPPMHCC